MAETASKLPEEDKPGIRPDIPQLRAQEGGGSETIQPGSGSSAETGSSNGSDSLFNPEGDTKKGPISPNDLAGAENRAALPGHQLGAGFNPSGKPPRANRFRALIGRNRRKAIVGGGVGASLIVILVLAFGAVVGFELVTIEKDIIKYEAKIEQHFEKKGAQDVLQKVITRLRQKTQGTPQQKQQIADEAKAGGELTSAMDKFNITDPKVVADLAGAGVTVQTDGQGNFTGIRDASGNDITGDVANPDSATFSEIETALPEWSVGQLESFRGLMTLHAGASFSGLPADTATDTVDKVVESKVVNGANNEELAAVSEKNGTQAAANDPVPAEVANSAKIAQEGGALGNAINVTEQAANSGANGAAAVQAGVDSVDLGNALFATGVVTTACSLEQDVSHISASRVPTIMRLLIRHGTLLVSLADELKTGNIRSGVVSKVMGLLNGDPAAKPTSNGTTAEAALPFSSSAAWHRATGATVTSNTPDVSASSLPVANTGTRIVNQLQGIMNAIPGAGFGCSVLNSPFSFIVQGFAGVAQIISDFGSFGVAQAGILAANVAAQASIKILVLPEIIKYFTPFGINGTENAVQWLGNSGLGLNLSFNDYARSIGASPVKDSVANNITAQATASETLAQQRLPWVTRTFSPNNPDSLVSHLALYMPTSNNQLLTGFASFFTNLPNTISHSFAALIMPKRAMAAATAENPGQPYGVTQYALTDSQVTKYDPVQNEIYLKSNVSVTTDGGQTLSVPRLTMTGDPSAFQPGSADPSTTDLLHCFINGFDTSSVLTSPDSICGSEGSFDSSSLSPTAISDQGVANAYCGYFLSQTLVSNCTSQVMSQIKDDIGHFQQYLLDVHVMKDYTSLGAKP